ncbi:hypothetical protein VOI32_34915 [Paraburkholderia caribensis]|jgi:hypothetical protein|uniref:Uncharacterized protein n=1 Tax=Paraburkholderia caribensis TaxID=75105 RepID=A0ABV0E753_9BURK|nr:hypothetical protein [Paraburkholderia caribensis]AUT54602.1 hypothetical protein C2L66_22450 [Paraburkholderia caribensis]MCO4882377.1 hypothetical protein [Paraburkholderia caribensis]MDR6387025.1 hypothetical protein [Paraburkholderia caribensis]PTB24338.1 hypothetical protein C9I56_34380 [Paraburkholderia caribensis]CAG9199580.1 conserved hypothetical protein [Paraburkholderia caribensis]
MRIDLIACRPARLKRTLIMLVGCAGVLASLSIWGRVPADALADADREVAQSGPALPGSACTAEGAVSRDAHGTFLMCWRLVWSKP